MKNNRITINGSFIPEVEIQREKNRIENKKKYMKKVKNILDLLVATFIMIGNFGILYILLILFAKVFQNSLQFGFLVMVSFMTTIIMVVNWYEIQKKIIKQ